MTLVIVIGAVGLFLALPLIITIIENHYNSVTFTADEARQLAKKAFKRSGRLCCITFNKTLE